MKPPHVLIVLAAGAALLLRCVDQPRPNCVTSPPPNGYVVKLIELSREPSEPGACDGFGPDSFNEDPVVGISPYYRRDEKGQPDYDHGSVAIQTAEIGSLLATAQSVGEENRAGGPPYSYGEFRGGEPDASDFCTVETFTPTHLVLPEIPAAVDDPDTEEREDDFMGQPAVDVTLEWSRFQVYVTAASYGTQFVAELKDTRVTEGGDSCVIRYRALGLAPVVWCAITDDEGEPLLDPESGLYQPDLAACDPHPDPKEGRFVGSGIAPNTRYTCDTTIGYCAIEGDTVPALR